MKSFFAVGLVCLLLGACASPKIDGPMLIGKKKPPTRKIVHREASREVALHSAGIKPVAIEETGSYMDRQVQALREKIIFNNDLKLSRDAYDIVILAQGSLVFEENGLQLSAKFKPTLQHLSDALNAYEKTTVTITGHTDSNGAERFNRSVSEFRAAAISDAMRENGVLAMRIRTVGEGEALPVASNKTFRGRKRNNRIEIRISPI